MTDDKAPILKPASGPGKTIGQIAYEASGIGQISGYVTEAGWEAAASAVWDEAVAKCIEAQQEAIDEAISEMNELAILGVEPMWNSLISRFDDLSEALRSLKRTDKTDTDDLCQAKSSAEGDTVSAPAEPLQASLGAGAMGHLGDVLSFFANLDEGDRCDAFEEAVAFYNKNNPDSQIQGEPGFTWYICQRSPLGFNCRHPLEERSDEVSPHGKATPDTINQEADNG